MLLFSNDLFAQSQNSTVPKYPTFKSTSELKARKFMKLQKVAPTNKKTTKTYSKEELIAMKNAEIKLSQERASKKAEANKKIGGYTIEAMDYLRSLEHPEFMDIHGETRKQAIKAWKNKYKGQFTEIQAKVTELNQCK